MALFIGKLVELRKRDVILKYIGASCEISIADFP